MLCGLRQFTEQVYQMQQMHQVYQVKQDVIEKEKTKKSVIINSTTKTKYLNCIIKL